MEKIRLESEAVMLNNGKQMQRLMESQQLREVEFKKIPIKIPEIATKEIKDEININNIFC